jgi:hypothetical protein
MTDPTSKPVSKPIDKPIPLIASKPSAPPPPPTEPDFLSVRDVFAGAAMEGMLSRSALSPVYVAQEAYRVADEMMRVRERGGRA